MPFYKQKSNPVNISGNIHQINFALDDFMDVRKEDLLYVDKTKLIEDILTYDKRAVLLFIRPRRFGKSLNLSMLRYFFDITEDSSGIFEGLYIEKSIFFTTHLNQYPVLYLNFKDIKVDSIQDINNSMVRKIEIAIKELYKKHQFEELINIELMTETGALDTIGVKEITRVLYENTNKKVIVLIDEYDSIINQTYGTDYWKDITDTIKRMFGMLLKSNEYLEMGVLTGVSRIGKELGFSDMNNLSIIGLTNPRYYEYFGFTENEVNDLLKLTQIEMKQEFYDMYNGYHFEDSPNMFNTVSILKFLYNYHSFGKVTLSPYWLNSSVNSILKDNIAKQDHEFKEKLLGLLDGSTIMESIYESIDYDRLDNPAYMFSLLIDTGYLCPIHKLYGDAYELKIPNKEVLYGYKELIDLITGIDDSILVKLCEKLIKSDIISFEKILNDILLHIPSFHDFSERENSYHNLLLGALLLLLGRFKIYSNREAGHGRYDIAIIPVEKLKKTFKPIIIEYKVPKKTEKEQEYTDDQLIALAKTAITQINEKKYYEEYLDMYTNLSSGMFTEDDFIKIGIAAQGKRCRVWVG